MVDVLEVEEGAGRQHRDVVLAQQQGVQAEATLRERLVSFGHHLNTLFFKEVQISHLEEGVFYLGDPVVGEVEVLERPHVAEGDEGDLTHQVVPQIQVGQHRDLKGCKYIYPI